MKFEILKSTAAQPYRWRIVAANGQVLATSENYASKQSAESACESVKKSAGSAEIVDLTAACPKAGPRAAPRSSHRGRATKRLPA